MSDTMRAELEPLGVRVITSICGSTDTPMFAKPGGPMSLTKTSYYHGIEDAAWSERMGHQRQATKVDVLAERLVREIVRGADKTVWHGAFASLVWWASFLHTTWLVDRLINSQRGLKYVQRR
jgi:1-acylglycerone phosphate reductase